MAEQGFLFAEMQLQAGDVIDCKGKRLFNLYKTIVGL